MGIPNWTPGLGPWLPHDNPSFNAYSVNAYSQSRNTGAKYSFYAELQTRNGSLKVRTLLYG